MKSVSNLELRRKLAQALKGGKYFITITYVRGSKLDHYMTYHNFPGGDILPTLDHFAGKVLEYESESDLETSTVARRHPVDDEGGSGSEEDIPRLADRRKDTMPTDLGEQPEPDTTEGE